MNLKRIIAAGLAAATIFANTAFAAETGITRGQVAGMLLRAADDYNPNIQYTDIIKGYEDGNLHEEQNVNRAEALVMLKRAFGVFPELTGHNERVALQSGSFGDIPDWAKAELQPVFDAGIAAGTEEGVFSPYDNVTKEQMELFIKRAYAVFGTNEKDDFYAAVNQDALNKLTLKPGRVLAGTLYDLGDQAGEEVNGILKEIVAKGGKKGSKEQKMADFYHNILDTESRNKTGVAPLQKYLDRINQAESIKDLMDAQSVMQNEISFAPYAAFSITVDFKDSTKYIPTFGTYEPIMPKNFYQSATEPQKNAYFQYLKTILSLAKEPADDQTINHFYAFEKALSEKALNPEESGNVDKIYHTFSLAEISAMLPSVDIPAVLKDSGIREEEQTLITNPEMIREFSKYFTSENLDGLKTAAKISLLCAYGGTLSTDFTAAADTFNAEYLGISGAYSDEERAALVVSNAMPDYLGEIYAEKYFTEEAKQNVLKMVQDIVSVYKSRIQKLDWMSDATKEKAIRKLDKMNIKIGYPDSFDTYLDRVEIQSASEGGSYFNNIIAIARASKQELSNHQGKPVDKTQWLMYPYTVNACYSATSNDITFPAAILQPPMYDVNASYEENLGAIGYIIAHEITHAFDNNGAKFDENGNAANWWTAEDYAEFEKRCEKMVRFYDGQEGIPGVPMNGRLTLSENVSDQGAVQCITEVVSQMENPDYQKLYHSMAKAWASTKTREYAKYASKLDVHSEDKLRVNRVVVNCDEFYQAFGITEKDGMWIAPEERVKIW